MCGEGEKAALHTRRGGGLKRRGECGVGWKRALRKLAPILLAAAAFCCFFILQSQQSSAVDLSASDPAISEAQKTFEASNAQAQAAEKQVCMHVCVRAPCVCTRTF